MRRKYYVLILSLLFAFGIKAQFVITYAGNAPQIGDVFNIEGTMDGDYDPGPAGGGQIWDFSAVQPNILGGITAIDPASTPFSSDFPEATIAFRDNDTSYEKYNYWNLSGSELFYLGMASDPGANQNINIFPDTRKIMQYPFAYNDSFIDSYWFPSISELMTIHHRGTISATADAWGVVKTPAGTFLNTLRVKKVKVYTDSVWNGAGDLMNVANHTETAYEWYSENEHYPILTIQVTETGSSSISYKTPENGIGTENLNPRIQVSPNPVRDELHVKISGNVDETFTIHILNLSSQDIEQFSHKGKSSFSIDVAFLPPGLYFLQIEKAAGELSSTKFIKRK